MVILSLLAYGVWKQKQAEKAEACEEVTPAVNVENNIGEEDSELDSSVESVKDLDKSLSPSHVPRNNECEDSDVIEYDISDTDLKRFSSVSDDDVKIDIFYESDSSANSWDGPEAKNHRIVRRSKSLGRKVVEVEERVKRPSLELYRPRVLSAERESRKKEVQVQTSQKSSKETSHPRKYTQLGRERKDENANPPGNRIVRRSKSLGPRISNSSEDTNRNVVELGKQVKRPSLELYHPRVLSAGRESRRKDVQTSQRLYEETSPPRKYMEVEKEEESDIPPGSVFDSHCHIDFCQKRLPKHINTLEKMLAFDGEGMELYRKGGSGKFGGCIAIYCDPRTWDNLPANGQLGVHISIGCHPHFVEHFNWYSKQKLDSWVSGNSKVANLVALGEIGLDYSPKNTASKDLQKRVFKDQLTLAMKHRLPVVLHIRDAVEDGYQVLREACVPPSYPLHLHCFSGSWEEASHWLQQYPGSVIGLTGLVTFSNAAQVREVARRIPLNRLILETDAPYFLPNSVDKTKYNDSTCLPGHVIHTAARIATLRGDNIENILAANMKNVGTIYGIKKIATILQCD